MLAFLLYSSAMQKGSVTVTTAALVVPQTAVPALVGTLLLGDQVREPASSRSRSSGSCSRCSAPSGSRASRPARPRPRSRAPPAPTRPVVSTPADDRALRRADFPVLREVPTRWADVDAYGHVNNAVHLAVFDTAVNAWLIEASGTDVRRLEALGLVVETSCRYFSELGFPAPITAGLRLEHRGRTSVVYRLALFGEGEEPAAVGRFVHVYVDRATRRPVEPPAPVRAALDRLS